MLKNTRENINQVNKSIVNINQQTENIKIGFKEILQKLKNPKKSYLFKRAICG